MDEYDFSTARYQIDSNPTGDRSKPQELLPYQEAALALEKSLRRRVLVNGKPTLENIVYGTGEWIEVQADITPLLKPDVENRIEIETVFSHSVSKSIPWTTAYVQVQVRRPEETVNIEFVPGEVREISTPYVPLSPAAEAAQLPARASAPESALEKRNTKNPARPAWVWRTRMVGRGSGPAPQSVPDALALARSFALDGYNLVETWVDHVTWCRFSADGKTYQCTTPIWDWDWKANKMRFQAMKAYTEAGHRLGLHFLFHDMDSLDTESQRGTPLPTEKVLVGKNGDIYCRKADGSLWATPRSGNEAIFWISAVCPKVIRGHVEIIPRLLQDTGLDGFYSDWVDQDNNYDRWSRALFSKATGVAAPSPAIIKKADMADPLYRAWNWWCGADYIKDILVATRNAIKAKDPQKIVFAYNSRPTRIEHETFPMAADLLGDEATDRTCFYNARDNAVQMKYDFAIESLHNVPMVALFKTEQPSEDFFDWAMAASNGVGDWNMIPPCARWQKQYQDLFTHPRRVPGDVAVLYSRRTRGLYYEHGATPPRPYEHGTDLFPWAGWARIFQDRHIQYDIILDGDLDPKTLSAYKLLVLSNTAVLSDADGQTLRDYVRQGGELIATYETSLYDGAGARRSDFALGDLFGVSFKEIVAGAHAASTRSMDRWFPAPPSSLETGWMVRTELRNPSPLVAVRDVRGFPYLVANQVGKGLAVYIAGFPGARVFSRPGRYEACDSRARDFVYQDPADAQTCSLLNRLIPWLLPRPSLEVRAPENVIVNSTRARWGATEGIAIHLLNAQGAILPNGTKVKAHYRVCYPRIREPIVLDLRDAPKKKAFMVSPDWPAPKATVVAEGGESCKVTLPAFNRYAVVFLY